MTASVFDHPFLSGLLGDAELSALFSAEADLRAMLAFEGALAAAEAKAGLVSPEAARAIAKGIASFEPDWPKLKRGTARDGVVVPELVRQLRSVVGPAAEKQVHFGATSQDVIDTSLALRMREALPLLEKRFHRLLAKLEALLARDGKIETMAHTRMQAAIAVPAERKIESWRQPLLRNRERLATVRDGFLILHFGGAAGTLDKLGSKGRAVSEAMAEALDLAAVSHPRHSERDGVVALADWLSLVTGGLGKMGADIALMAQSEVGEIRIKSGGGSSAMPHKVNPVGAEILVTLARFNATLVSGMHQSLVHENERSGAAWTLEWMLLPQMAVAAGAALRTAAELVGNIAFVSK
ncbi:MAG TPA: 3-carboxy-cis,cis-muconate cycloisomerase [Rhizobiaceae bacterium]|nr:3-carboxy-cis,cis-muconate cycloisomerase [Rhizobiaceae bacterium]